MNARSTSASSPAAVEPATTTVRPGASANLERSAASETDGAGRSNFTFPVTMILLSGTPKAAKRSASAALAAPTAARCESAGPYSDARRR